MKKWLRHHCEIITSFLKMYSEINEIKSSVTPEIKSLVHYTLLSVIRTINITNPGIFGMDTGTRAKQAEQDPNQIYGNQIWKSLSAHFSFFCSAHLQPV